MHAVKRKKGCEVKEGSLPALRCARASLLLDANVPQNTEQISISTSKPPLTFACVVDIGQFKSQSLNWNTAFEKYPNMSTIASPRDSSVNGSRIPQISTPTSSSRPSLEKPRSASSSPNRGPSNKAPKRNRAALREYYNLKKAVSELNQTQAPSSSASSIHDNNSLSEVTESELDSPSFNAEEYVKHVLETQSLGELLRTYNGVLQDIRALDAEKKALVYDNYSKLIAATETIRKMRDNMGSGVGSMGMTLDPAIRSVYERAETIKSELRKGMSESQRREMEVGEEERGKVEKRRRAREVVVRVLDTPEKIRRLVSEGKEDEARTVWESSLTLLERWKERGVGGSDVLDCIEDGEAALRGEPANEMSWVNVKARRELKS